MSAHRSGVLERVLNWMSRIPLVRRLAGPDRAEARAADRAGPADYGVLSPHPGRFVKAILLEYLSRCIFMLELVLIVASLGFRIGYLRRILDRRARSARGESPLRVPFEIGAREGAFYALFNLFGVDPQLGLYTSIASSRARLAWIGAGVDADLDGRWRRHPVPPVPPLPPLQHDDRNPRARDDARRKMLKLTGGDVLLAYISASRGQSITPSSFRSFWKAGLRKERGYYCERRCRSRTRCSGLFRCAFSWGTWVPALFFLIHLAMDYSVGYEKMAVVSVFAARDSRVLVGVSDKARKPSSSWFCYVRICSCSLAPL